MRLTGSRREPVARFALSLYRNDVSCSMLQRSTVSTTSWANPFTAIAVGNRS